MLVAVRYLDLHQQLEESNRNQQRFLANAAHQLRTPLAGLRAHAELALAQPLSEESRAEIEQMHRATVRIARLANEAFVSKAPAAVLEGARKQLADQRAKKGELEKLLSGLT